MSSSVLADPGDNPAKSPRPLEEEAQSRSLQGCVQEWEEHSLLPSRALLITSARSPPHSREGHQASISKAQARQLGSTDAVDMAQPVTQMGLALLDPNVCSIHLCVNKTRFLLKNLTISSRKCHPKY